MGRHLHFGFFATKRALSRLLCNQFFSSSTIIFVCRSRPTDADLKTNVSEWETVKRLMFHLRKPVQIYSLAELAQMTPIEKQMFRSGQTVESFDVSFVETGTDIFVSRSRPTEAD